MSVMMTGPVAPPEVRGCRRRATVQQTMERRGVPAAVACPSTLAAVLLALAGSASAQTPPATRWGPPPGARPVIDTVLIAAQNIFTRQEADRNFVYQVLNGVHVRTRPWVVREELLFEKGEPFDSARVAETERNLRARDLFRTVDIDTLHMGSQFAVRVLTQDGWSTKPRFKLAASSGGTVTGAVGITETNVLGTGNMLHVAYRRDVDHDGTEIQTASRRLLGSKLTARGNYYAWTDGKEGNWSLGLPFLSLEDRHAIVWEGDAANRRILDFRIRDPSAPDTTFHERRALVNRLTAGFAPVASPRDYVRLGVSGELRSEAFLFQRDTALGIPDTVSALFGAFLEYRHARYRKVRYFNRFAYEDQDLSTRVRLGAQLAPAWLGHRRAGIGPHLEIATAVPMHDAFVKAAVTAGGLITAAGVDSGTVRMDLTLGVQPAPRQATFVWVGGGLQESPRPGDAFDLGFNVPPRSWEPHSFVGTRMVNGTIEHRWFARNGFLGMFDLGFAGFADVGGAWYRDQPARFGGDVGVGVRLGGALSASGRAGRIDLGYRFGDGVVGHRWVLSVGHGFVF